MYTGRMMSLIVCERGTYPESNTLPKQHTPSPSRAGLLFEERSVLYTGARGVCLDDLAQRLCFSRYTRSSHNIRTEEGITRTSYTVCAQDNIRSSYICSYTKLGLNYVQMY